MRLTKKWTRGKKRAIIAHLTEEERATQYLIDELRTIQNDIGSAPLNEAQRDELKRLRDHRNKVKKLRADVRRKKV